MNGYEGPKYRGLREPYNQSDDEYDNKKQFNAKVNNGKGITVSRDYMLFVIIFAALTILMIVATILSFNFWQYFVDKMNSLGEYDILLGLILLGIPLLILFLAEILSFGLFFVCVAGLVFCIVATIYCIIKYFQCKKRIDNDMDG